MASWIKMCHGLRRDPAVVHVRKMSALSADEVVGKLHRFWCWADTLTEDGHIPAVDFDEVDDVVGHPGFAKALSTTPDSPWLSAVPDGIYIPNFEVHNGQSAKRRATDSVRKMSARAADKQRTREEKSREETTTTPKPPSGAVPWKPVNSRTDELCAYLDKAIRWHHPSALNKPSAIRGRKAVDGLLSRGISPERFIEVVGHVFGAESENPSDSDYRPDGAFDWRDQITSASKLKRHWDKLDILYAKAMNGRAVS